jgi:hypothetical protein
MKRCSVSIIYGIYDVRRWNEFRWEDAGECSKFQEDRFRRLGNISVITTIWGVVILVLLKEGVYDVNRRDKT